MATETQFSADEMILELATQLEPDPCELRPLYEVIDPELIGTCIEQTCGVSLSFLYMGATVTVDNTGEVEISESSTLFSKRTESQETETTD